MWAVVMERARPWAYALAVAGLGGCKPTIGSSCNVSTDCSSQNDRACDTAQPGGYCTQLNCTNGSCPDNAVCVEFGVAVPGCPYSDYHAPSRSGVAFCMQHCSSAGDCRAGYVCQNPTTEPWNGAILDNNQQQSVCVSAPTAPPMSSPVSLDGSACNPGLPSIPEAGGVSEGGDATPDAPGDATDAAVADEGAADAPPGE